MTFRIGLTIAAALLSACSRQRPSPSPPVDAAGPREISVRVPAGLRLARSLDSLSVSVDPAALGTTQVTAGPGMFVGVETRCSVVPVGRPPQARGARQSVRPGESFDVGASTWTVSADGVPAAGIRYMAEMELVLFETDIPPRQGWDPHAGSYQVLWTRTLRQAEE